MAKWEHFNNDIFHNRGLAEVFYVQHNIVESVCSAPSWQSRTVQVTSAVKKLHAEKTHAAFNHCLVHFPSRSWQPYENYFSLSGATSSAFLQSRYGTAPKSESEVRPSACLVGDGPFCDSLWHLRNSFHGSFCRIWIPSSEAPPLAATRKTLGCVQNCASQSRNNVLNKFVYFSLFCSHTLRIHIGAHHPEARLRSSQPCFVIKGLRLLSHIKIDSDSNEGFLYLYRKL